MNIKRLLKDFVKIGVNGSNIDSIFTNTMSKYSISISNLENIAKLNSRYTNFDLASHVVFKVFAPQSDDYFAQWQFYALLAEYAEKGEQDIFRKLRKMSMWYHLKWKLTNQYGMIISNRGCNQCVNLDSKCLSSDELISLMTPKSEICEHGRFKCTVVTLSERQYLKRHSER